MTSNNAYSPVGLDIGQRKVRAVQLVRDRAGVRLHRAASPGLASRTDGPGLCEPDDFQELWGTLQRRGFRGDEVVLSAPGVGVRTSVVECPRTDSKAAIDAIVRSELARAHSITQNEFESAWWPLPTRASGGASVLASACGHEAAAALLAMVEAAGAQLRAIDLRPLALARAATSLLSSDDGALDAIIELGWDSSRVVMVGMGSVLYVRELPECRLSDARDQLVTELNVEEEVAERLLTGLRFAHTDSALARLALAGLDHIVAMIAHELEMSVSYAVRQFGIEQTGRVVLMGDGHDAPGIGGRITEATGLDVFAWEAPGAGCSPAFAAAWGLAARFND